MSESTPTRIVPNAASTPEETFCHLRSYGLTIYNTNPMFSNQTEPLDHIDVLSPPPKLPVSKNQYVRNVIQNAKIKANSRRVVPLGTTPVRRYILDSDGNLTIAEY